MANDTSLTAKWIWKDQDSYHPYQQVVVAQKILRLASVKQAEMRITADGGYRLFVNGEWVNDGPCRSWPEHFQYDRIDLMPYLVNGENEIVAIVRHWSVGNFHTVPQQAGLLAQLDLIFTNGNRKRIKTDRSWLVADAPAWIPRTPKVSIQMEPQEYYDARLEDDLVFEPAVELYPALEGPWHDLHARDSVLLNRKSLPLRSFKGANIVRRQYTRDYCVPVARLVHPALVEANRSVSLAGGMCTLLQVNSPTRVEVTASDFLVSIDGITQMDGFYNLDAGTHFMTGLSIPLFGHNKERSIRFRDLPPAVFLINPIDSSSSNPWVWIDVEGFDLVMDDMIWPENQNLDTHREKMAALYEDWSLRLSREADNFDKLRTVQGIQLRCLSAEEMFVTDSHQAFLDREVLGDGVDLIVHPSGLMHESGEVTMVHPSSEGDVELVYDLGEQTVGYLELDLLAEEGVEIDLFGVEYIARDGAIQHTFGNRNGFRYITREGINRFISLKRRSQRYLFVTFRRQSRPVRIRKIQLIESTYPIDQQGWFSCSEARFDDIYAISARTLKLCMEDTFTDCPLFEQTHWVGDARNEAVFAFSTFGAQDLARRCIRLAAQSLERYPIVGCQVPSGWDCLLPAWSFLWGISVWDYYMYTGDRQFLKEMWPAVLRNLAGAEKLLDGNGLFSGPFWNMFDWTGIDDKHNTVLHNSMLMVGAINAAVQCARILADRKEQARLSQLGKNIIGNLNRLWDVKKQAYPDSIHANGSISKSVSMHTSFLSILYDIASPDIYPAALNNTLIPPDEMVKVGAPFASMYFYEALEKAGRSNEIIQSIYDNYVPMVEDGATTVWEVFPVSHDRPAGFPTRSHTHAWSSAPLYFLPRILLGIASIEPGGAAYAISPHPSGLSWASGAVATPRGPLQIDWDIKGKTLRIQAKAPKGIRLFFKSNPDIANFNVEHNLLGEA
jgi:alpha-L-rhamnosidase